jgi:RNA polymerase sigma factor (sigma-70 family)
MQHEDDPMSDTRPDEELMLRVRNDEVDELSDLFARYHVPLYNFFLRLTADPPASEDLVQDTFYRVLKYRRTYKPGTSFRTWIYQIARNVRNDRFHGEREETGIDSAPEPTVLPVDTAESEQQSARLKQALMDLPEDKRELLLLSRYQGLKYEQIANVLQCEVGTVKVRVHRALQELKERFHRREIARRRPQENLGG